MYRCIISVVAALLLSLACGKEASPAVQGEDFSVVDPIVEVSERGAECEVEYRLKEFVGDIMPVAVTEAAWITDIDNTQKGVIKFRVLPNLELQSREATLTLKYIDIATQPQITVRQAGAVSERLKIELTDVDYSECSVTITPDSDDITYIAMMAEKRYFEERGITNAEELVASDEALFTSYITDGSTLEEFLTASGLAMQGVGTKRWQDLSPAKEYVIYAYGVDVQGDSYEPITPIYHKVVDKRMPERVAQSFEVEIEAQGPEVTFNIDPKGWEGYYVVQLVEDGEAGYIEQGQPFTAEAEEQVAEAFFYIADHLYYFEQRSAEEVMQQLGYRGEVSYTKSLNANHRYMALIYAVASDNGNVPMVVSRPQVEYFSTGAVESSDMTFTVEISNILPRSVDVRITPSTDEPYTAVMMYAKNLPEGDKQQQLEYVMSNYAPLEISGVYEEHIDQLPPETEFVIAVYGYYAGAATTELFLYRFATASDAEGHNKIVKVSFSAYDMAEVVAIEPYYASMMGYADYFLSMDVETLTPAPTLHFELYAKSQYDSYTHAEIRESLLEYSYTSSPDWALCSYGNEYVLCGLAEDENGYVGEMYVSEPISFTSEQTSDAAIFVELYKEYVER